VITFQVPLPPRELSPNTYKHWRKVSGAKKEYRNLVYLEGLHKFDTPSAGDVGFARCRLSLTFCIKGGRPAYQPRDAANALSAFKAGIDGLVDAGMCPDDSQKHLELGAILIDSKRGPFVEVTVEAI
jgi:hypothetical protein